MEVAFLKKYYNTRFIYNKKNLFCYFFFFSLFFFNFRQLATDKSTLSVNTYNRWKTERNWIEKTRNNRRLFTTPCVMDISTLWNCW